MTELIMEFLAQFAAWSLLAFGLLLFLTQVAAREVGYWLGQRKRAARGESEAEGVGLVVGGMLGLLGFVLALTLSFGSSRFAERREGTLAEANAIGTAWLRAEAIGHPRSNEIAQLLQDYGRLRKDYVRAPRNSPAIGQINQRISALQTEIWGHMSAIARERSDAVVVSLMAALNEAFDMSTAARFAHESRFPPPLFWLLIGMAHISMAALGYQLGLKGQRSHTLPTLLTAEKGAGEDRGAFLTCMGATLRALARRCPASNFSYHKQRGAHDQVQGGKARSAQRLLSQVDAHLLIRAPSPAHGSRGQAASAQIPPN